MSMERTYCLREGIQVRREKFGLLFYSYNGPRLYFVPSRELLEEDFFAGERTLGEVVESLHRRHQWPRPWIADRLEQVLDGLEQRRLIFCRTMN